MLNKTNYFRTLSYILVLTTFLPVVTNNLPPIISSYHLYAVLWLLSTLILEPKIYSQKLIVIFLIYGLFFVFLLPKILWRYMDDWNMEAIQMEFYNMLIPLTILYYYRINKDFKGWSNLVKLAFIFIAVTAVMTFYASSINPLYSRNITSGVLSDSELDFFKRIGGGTYGYAIALIGVFPILVFYYKHNIKSLFFKGIIIVYGLLIYFAIIRMQFFANILISSLIIIIAMLGTKNRKRSIIVISFLLFFAIITPKIVYSDFLIHVSSWFNPDSETYLKLNDMALYIIGETEGSITEQRTARFPELLEAFLSRPFLGNSSFDNSLNIGTGGHLYWMNRLAIWGLLGLLFYTWIHYTYIITILKDFDKIYSFFFLLSIGSVLSYGLIKNIAGREVWFAYFVIIPGAYYLPLIHKKILSSRKNASNSWDIE